MNRVARSHFLKNQKFDLGVEKLKEISAIPESFDVIFTFDHPEAIVFKKF